MIVNQDAGPSPARADNATAPQLIGRYGLRVRLRVTRNPFQRAAVVFIVAALIAQSAGSRGVGEALLGVALVFALIAVVQRRKYPRR